MTGDSDRIPDSAASCGDDRLRAVYDELRAVAERQLHDERKDHTLQPTALVHEAYLRLLQGGKVRHASRADLLRVAARAMRHVLVDHARRRNAQKRRPEGHRVAFADFAARFDKSAIDLAALDEALARLSTLDPDLTTLLELKFFGGCTEPEIAEALQISTRTVRRQWRIARAWLRNQIDGGQPHGP